MGFWKDIVKAFTGKESQTAPTAQVNTAQINTTKVQSYPAYTPNPSSVRQSSHSATAPRAGNWFNGIGKKAPVNQEYLTVYSWKGSPLELTAMDCKGSGGEGSVYSIPSKNNLALVKVYNDNTLEKEEKRREIERRISAMIVMSQKMDTTNLAWPRGAVYDKNQKMIGFIMNKCAGHPFNSLSAVMGVKKCFPSWDRRQLVLTAIDFVRKVRMLADHGIFVNDFNPANFMVDEKCNVSFIDCDSYQVPGTDGKPIITRTYFSSHVAPELLLQPEQLAKPRNIHHVEFGTAILVFNLLMCGLHPYAYFDPSRKSGCSSPDENLKRGKCPLGTGAGCKLPNGNWYNLWSQLTYNLKGALIATFRDGHTNPEKRTTLAQLQNHLEEMLYVLGKEEDRRDLTPKSAKPHNDQFVPGQKYGQAGIF